MKYILAVSVLFLLVILSCVPNSTCRAKTSGSNKPLYGLNFSPYLETQDPNVRSIISEGQISFRLQPLVPLTEWIRTFSCGDGLENIGGIAHKMGLKTLIGAWIGTDMAENDKQIEAIIRVAVSGDADIVAIGNEVLLRGDLTEDQLIAYINKVKNALKDNNRDVRVSTVDGYYFFLSHPRLIDACDVLLINCYPFWDNIDIDDSINALNRMYENVISVSKGKEVIITETGWPSDGKRPNSPTESSGVSAVSNNAVPSITNATRYFQEVVDWASKRKVKYFYFSAYDESWKASAEGTLGAYWGVFNNNGILKYNLNNRKAFLPGEIQTGTILQIDGIFIPSGWMGDTNDIQISTTSDGLNETGKKVLRIDLSAASSPNWSGIYWQYPANNWGSQPGLRISGAKRLTFQAKGETGLEKVTFKTGGIDGGDGYKDSVNPALVLREPYTQLSSDWRQYAINLEGKNMDSVIGAFCCVASRRNNPNGCVFYLSDIKFEW